MNPKLFRKILITVVIVILLIFAVLMIIASVRQQPVTDFVSRGTSLFPFGRREVTVTPSEPGTLVPEDGIPGNDQPIQTIESEDGVQLRQVSEFPVTGFVPLDRYEDFTREFENADGEMETEVIEILVPHVRFNAKENGYIYESRIQNGVSETQITATDIPRAQEVVFDSTGNNVVLRFFNESSRTVESFVATIPERAEPPSVCEVVITTDLQRGDRGVLVTELQTFLNYEMSRDMSTDGVFGGGTESALRDYQTSESLEATGITDEATRSAIEQSCVIIQQEIILAEQNPLELVGGFFIEDISAFVSGMAEDEFLYVFDQEDNTFFVTSNVSGSEKRQVFDSPYSEWLPQWVNSNTVALTTRASVSSPGYLYHLNLSRGELKRITGGQNGLTTLTSPNGLKVLLSEGSGNSMRTSIYDVTNRSTRQIGLATLSEKCVWRNDSVVLYCAVPTFIERGQYPDDWYQGQIIFNDAIWSINTDTLETNIIMSPFSEVGQEMDIIQPRLNPAETNLFFIDQRTGVLWSLEL